MKFNIKNKSDYNCRIVPVQEGEVWEYKLLCDFGEKIRPEETEVSFDIEYGGAFSIWNYSCNQDRRLLSDWRENLQKVKSRLACGLPLHSVIAQNGDNVFTVSVSDIKNSIEISSGINDKRVSHNCIIKFFTQTTEKMDSYEAIIRIDTRKINFKDAIGEAVESLKEINGLKASYIPDDARKPVFSTWYNFHQDINEENLLSQCEKAYELGMRTIIIDDGWQTDDNEGGYAYCGDWAICKKKFPDMRGFIEKVHKTGLKAMMWYSVPYIGKHSQAWKQFEGKFLDDPNQDWCCLDPRFPDVRDFLINKYEEAIKKWNIDGFKLDFIDAFELTEYSDTESKERDFDSLEDAVWCLISKINERLKAINPDILIEFRQNYIGPVITTYSNMVRVGDCAMDSITNRIGVLDLRLTSGETAVHSDMIIWDYNDEAYIAAKQLIAVLFGVPQISVLLDELPRTHYRMLKTYLNFFNGHRKTLLEGKLSVFNPECGYSMAEAENEDEKITVCYSKNIVNFHKGKHYIVNGTGDTYVIIRAKENIKYTIYDCMGNIVSDGEKYVDGITEFDVPESGIMKLE